MAAAPRIVGDNCGDQGIRIHLSQAEPGAPAALMLGSSNTTHLGVPLPAKLDPDGFPGAACWWRRA